MFHRFSVYFLILTAVYCEECNLPVNLKEEISSYAPKVQEIIDTALKGAFKNVTYNSLAEFVDNFGNRLPGSENLERSIDYMVNKSIDSGLGNVHTEQVPIPHWVRGEESATLLLPFRKKLGMLGLGLTVGTPQEGITAEVIVVKTFAELKAKASQVEGKIVVFNQDFTTYGQSVKYRSDGATEAAKLGAIATLIRSVTPMSLYTPHTGAQYYSSNIPKIPTACITVEDAHMLQRMYNRHQTIRIHLKMGAQFLPNTTSRNTFADIKGRENPEKFLIISGHIDSWDVGVGAMDDGGGLFVTWASAALLKHLGFIPRRTIR